MSHRFRTQSLWQLAVALALTLAATAFADPPRVVKAEPDNGDADIDPRLTELRIEFDQNMNPGGHSICGGGETLPKINGKPKWQSPRILIIPIQLEEDHDYQFSVNCPAAQNFRSAAGEPAVVYPIHFRTRGKDKALVKLTPEQNKLALDEVLTALKEKYSYYDVHEVDWDAAVKNFGPKLEHTLTAAAFARELANFLGAADDLHITVAADKMVFPTHRRHVEPNIHLATVEKLVPEFKKHNDCLSTGRFTDGVLYVLVSSWSNDCRDKLEPAFAPLKKHKDAPGVVIDVRPNGGGDELLAQKLAGCFVEKPAVYSKNQYRAAGEPGGFGPVLERKVQPNEDGPQFRGKVAVLMGPANVSSCESFLLMMKQAPQCKLFGERSYGSSGNPKPVKLSNGVTVFLPSWKDLRPDGTLLEGNGVDPDVVVTSKPKEREVKDPVLDAGLRWLRG